jgi:hypothetical protein
LPRFKVVPRFGAWAYALVLVWIATPAAAQGPAADWRTASTAHFRVHYPKASEAWALRAASRLESIRAAVIAEVGYEPPQIVDVFVSDPVAEPNGMALPLLGRPRMVLWTSPPDAGSTIGHYRDWIELLAVHEETHLVHLLRPSRNRLRGDLPLGPLALAPRWVSEGYATLVEGRLTGSGRPNGDLRAAVLRRWAAAGKLPSYDRLASDRDGYLGMSMAYLAGSAYLEWLERRAEPGSLKRLWARMSARTPRSFDDSFKGVFAGPVGSSPRDLWDRFRAELSAQAIEIEKRLAPLREGELWQDLPRGAGAPAVSPSGDLLAVVRERREEAGELVVYEVKKGKDEKDIKDSKDDKDKKAKKRALDPEDVPAVKYGPPDRRPRYRLTTWGGRAPSMPRFIDEDEVLFVRFEPDGEGFLHPDLFVWTLPSGQVRRITRGADLRDADPSADGTWAVALRQRHGFSQVVRVDLATGAVAPITEPSVEDIYDAPRLSRDGGRLAFLRHTGGSWRLMVRDLGNGAERELPLPEPDGASTPSAPAWSADGKSIFASLGREGRIDLVEFPADGAGGPTGVTRTAGAAFSPAPTPDGRALFYLSLEPQGLDLRRIELASAAGEPGAAVPLISEIGVPDLAPAVRPNPPPRPVDFAAADVAPGRPYGLGRMEWLPLFGGSIATAAGNRSELGLRLGDPLGRFEVVALGGLAGADGAEPRGASLNVSFHGLPVGISLRGFDLAERPSRATRAAPGSGLDLDRSGIELSAEVERSFGLLRTRTLANVRIERIDPVGGERTESRSRAGLEIGGAADLSRGKLRFEPRISLYGAAGSGIRRTGGRVGIALEHGSWGLDLGLRSDRVWGARFDFDRFQVGGPPSGLLPWSPERIEVAALAPGALLGTRHEGQRADLAVPGLPFHLLYERHRVASDLVFGAPGEGGFGPWLALAGIERRFGFGPYPLAGLPAFEARVGAAQIVDDPRRDEIGERRGWLVLVWRPR